MARVCIARAFLCVLGGFCFGLFGLFLGHFARGNKLLRSKKCVLCGAKIKTAHYTKQQAVSLSYNPNTSALGPQIP